MKIRYHRFIQIIAYCFPLCLLMGALVVFPGLVLAQDTDGDGIPDATEFTNGTDPYDDDSDDDGLLDGNEDMNFDGVIDVNETDPLNYDTDGDGLQDGTELGLVSAQGVDTGGIFIPDSDPATTTDPLDPDTDNDGLSDGAEDANSDGDLDTFETDPLDADTDDDGLDDGDENIGGTDPLDADTDADGLNDGLELGVTVGIASGTSDVTGVAYSGTAAGWQQDTDGGTTTDPLDADSDADGLCDGNATVGGVCAAGEDADGDGAVDATETDPNDADTDGDGYSDGDEVDAGTDPLDSASNPGGGGGDSSSSEDSGGGCLIATAARGSYLDSHLAALRDFRDRRLLTNAPGRWTVKWYYRLSPHVADGIRNREGLRRITRWGLTPVVMVVEYPALLWGLLLLFAGGGFWIVHARYRK